MLMPPILLGVTSGGVSVSGLGYRITSGANLVDGMNFHNRPRRRSRRLWLGLVEAKRKLDAEMGRRRVAERTDRGAEKSLLNAKSKVNVKLPVELSASPRLARLCVDFSAN